MYTWDWAKDIGTVDTNIWVKKDDSSQMKIYKGNGYAIFVAEWKEDGNDMYEVYSFFVDKQHLRNCMKDNLHLELFKHFNSVDFHKYDKSLDLLYDALAQAGVRITFENGYPF